MQYDDAYIAPFYNGNMDLNVRYPMLCTPLLDENGGVLGVLQMCTNASIPAKTVRRVGEFCSQVGVMLRLVSQIGVLKEAKLGESKALQDGLLEMLLEKRAQDYEETKQIAAEKKKKKKIKKKKAAKPVAATEDAPPEQKEPAGPAVMVTVLGAHDLRNADGLFGKSDPFVELTWRGTSVGKTATVNNDHNPTWMGEHFTFPIGDLEGNEGKEGKEGAGGGNSPRTPLPWPETDGSLVLEVAVIDYDTVSAHDLLGRVFFPLDEMLRLGGEGGEGRDSEGVEFVLIDVKGKKKGKSKVRLAFHTIPAEAGWGEGEDWKNAAGAETGQGGTGGNGDGGGVMGEGGGNEATAAALDQKEREELAVNTVGSRHEDIEAVKADLNQKADSFVESLFYATSDEEAEERNRVRAVSPVDSGHFVSMLSQDFRDPDGKSASPSGSPNIMGGLGGRGGVGGHPMGGQKSGETKEEFMERYRRFSNVEHEMSAVIGPDGTRTDKGNRRPSFAGGGSILAVGGDAAGSTILASFHPDSPVASGKKMK